MGAVVFGLAMFGGIFLALIISTITSHDWRWLMLAAVYAPIVVLCLFGLQFVLPGSRAHNWRIHLRGDQAWAISPDGVEFEAIKRKFLTDYYFKVQGMNRPLTLDPSYFVADK